MAASTRRWTRRDLQRLPDDGNRYEVIRGQLFVTALPRPDHDGIVRAIRRRLEHYVDAEGLGVISEASAFVVTDSEAQPDLVARQDVKPRPRDWKHVAPPILVVEVASDSTSRRDRTVKRAYYSEEGIPEYWIVDGERRTITVVHPGVEDVEESGVLRWNPAGATAPLEIDVAELFRSALDP